MLLGLVARPHLVQMRLRLGELPPAQRIHAQGIVGTQEEGRILLLRGQGQTGFGVLLGRRHGAPPVIQVKQS